MPPERHLTAVHLKDAGLDAVESGADHVGRSATDQPSEAGGGTPTGKPMLRDRCATWNPYSETSRTWQHIAIGQVSAAITTVARSIF